MDHLLGDKASVTIYFCLTKYHRSNVREGKLLKEVIEEHIKKDDCFAS
jgi:hypothetical protein